MNKLELFAFVVEVAKQSELDLDGELGLMGLEEGDEKVEELDNLVNSLDEEDFMTVKKFLNDALEMLGEQ